MLNFNFVFIEAAKTRNDSLFIYKLLISHVNSPSSNNLIYYYVPHNEPRQAKNLINFNK